MCTVLITPSKEINLNDTKPPTPTSIPEFFFEMMHENGMSVIAENVVVVYEQGQGGDIVTKIGTLVKPNELQEEMMPGMLWLLPRNTRDGGKAQSENLVQMLQINRRFLIEIGSNYNNEDDE